MVAGMLTAIRSFVNDCIAQSGNTSELNEIEYGSSKIILEVAGYCYLAVVIEGEPSRKYIVQIRETLATIIQKYGRQLKNLMEIRLRYQGSGTARRSLNPTGTKADKYYKYPITLLLMILGLLGAIAVPLGMSYYRDRAEGQVETQITEALTKTPELSVYSIDADAEGDRLTLTGRVPNEYLRSKAEQIARKTAPDLELENQIDAVEIPADPILTAQEVETDDIRTQSKRRRVNFYPLRVGERHGSGNRL